MPWGTGVFVSEGLALPCNLRSTAGYVGVGPLTGRCLRCFVCSLLSLSLCPCTHTRTWNSQPGACVAGGALGCCSPRAVSSRGAPSPARERKEAQRAGDAALVQPGSCRRSLQEFHPESRPFCCPGNGHYCHNRIVWPSGGERGAHGSPPGH